MQQKNDTITKAPARRTPTALRVQTQGISGIPFKIVKSQPSVSNTTHKMDSLSENLHRGAWAIQVVLQERSKFIEGYHESIRAQQDLETRLNNMHKHYKACHTDNEALRMNYRNLYDSHIRLQSQCRHTSEELSRTKESIEKLKAVEQQFLRSQQEVSILIRRLQDQENRAMELEDILRMRDNELDDFKLKRRADEAFSNPTPPSTDEAEESQGESDCGEDSCEKCRVGY